MRNKQKQVNLRDAMDVLDLIGGRWRGAILASLCDKGKRFNELKRDLGNITPRTLSRELKYLELNKLVEKDNEINGPGFALYRLTPHGESLEPLIGSIVSWGQKHRKVIMGE